MTISEIKTIVCEAFDIQERAFSLFKKHHSNAYPRYAYFVLAIKHKKFTHGQIANSVNHVRQSVTRGLIRHGYLIENDNCYAFAFKKAEKELKEKIKGN